MKIYHKLQTNVGVMTRAVTELVILQIGYMNA